MRGNLELNNFFSSLLLQLDTNKEDVIFLPQQEVSIIDPQRILQKSKLIEQAQPLTSTICNGCERSCLKPVQFRSETQNIISQAFIICDEREDMGRVPINFSQLEMQAFSLQGLAKWLAKELPTNRVPMIAPATLIYLGGIDIQDNYQDLFLIKGVNQIDVVEKITNDMSYKQAIQPVLLSLTLPKIPLPAPFVSVETFIQFHNKGISFSKNLFKLAILPKTLKKRGAKPQHDWPAYRNKFNELIGYYGKPGIDQPELKNQAAVETKLMEWGLDRYGQAPSPASIRRFVAQWLKEISAHN